MLRPFGWGTVMLVRATPHPHQPLTFAAIGALSTAAYVLIYAVTRSEASAQYANAIALALTTVANTQVNRRFTLGIRGGRGLVADHLAGFAAR
jgi:putative flippase GtrA